MLPLSPKNAPDVPAVGIEWGAVRRGPVPVAHPVTAAKGGRTVYFIGLDIGTSATKLLLMDEGGEVLNILSRSYPISFPEPGWSEQDPASWWDAVRTGVLELGMHLAGGGVGSRGIVVPLGQIREQRPDGLRRHRGRRRVVEIRPHRASPPPWLSMTRFWNLLDMNWSVKFWSTHASKALWAGTPASRAARREKQATVRKMSSAR